MTVLREENIVLFDVDSTLIMHDLPSCIPKEEELRIVDPLDTAKVITVRINQPMVRLLREEHYRGSYILVLSRGGYQWATNVIRALGFSNWDKLMVLSKPLAYFDDKPVQEWLPYRVYIGPNEIYKNKG